MQSHFRNPPYFHTPINRHYFLQQDSTIGGPSRKLPPVPRYKKTLAEIQAEGIKRLQAGEDPASNTEAEEHEDLVDLSTPFAEPGALANAWSVLSDDIQIMQTDEGKLRDAMNSKIIFQQGLRVLRAGKLAEKMALQKQSEAIIAQAKAVQLQQRAVHIELAGIQRMELGLSFTPATELSGLVRGSLMSSEELGLRQKFTPNPDVSTASQELASVSSQRSVRLPAGSRATGKSDWSISVPAPCHGGKEYHAVVMYEMVPGSQKKVAYFVCPWTACQFRRAGRDSVNAHIRQIHTDQVLQCPNLRACSEVETKLHPFTTRNADSLRAHYRNEAEQKGIYAGPRDRPQACFQINTPLWFSKKATA